MSREPPMIQFEITSDSPWIDPHCPFCRKIKDRCGEIIYEDDQIVLFNCESPVATYHFLAVPRSHAIDVKDLNDSQKQLILKIACVCRLVLGLYGADVDDSIVGYYHMPSEDDDAVRPHLNFHVISPTREMSHMNKVLYKPSGAWFSTIDQILNIE